MLGHWRARLGGRAWRATTVRPPRSAAKVQLVQLQARQLPEAWTGLALAFCPTLPPRTNLAVLTLLRVVVHPHQGVARRLVVVVAGWQRLGTV